MYTNKFFRLDRIGFWREVFRRCDGQTFCLARGCHHPVVSGDLSPWPNLAISAVAVVAPPVRIAQKLLAPAQNWLRHAQH